MNYDIKNGILHMVGFNIGGKILISEADEVTVRNECTDEFEKAEEVKVIMEVETLKSWIEECGLLDDIEFMEL